MLANIMTNMGLISNICKQFIKLSIKKTWLKNRQKRACRWHMKWCSTLLIIREMQIRITVRYHLTPVRTRIIKMNTNNNCWPGFGEKGILIHCWWGCKLVQPLWKTVWRLLKTLKIEILCYPTIPFLECIYSWNIYKKTKALILKDNMYPNVHSSIIYCQVMEAT